MKLLIVESPNKIAKLRPLVGPGFRIAASFGHIRDLPAKGDLAIDFRDGRVLPHYEPLEKGGRAIAELTSLAKVCDEVWLATDPDREGEAIAWHITQIIGEHRYQRVAFQAITAAAVKQALSNPRSLDRGLVDAQQARRVLDRVVGWLVSPTLRSLGRDAKSAGRVQSVALRLVAEREMEIRTFNAVDHFVLAAKLERTGSPPPFRKVPLVERSRTCQAPERYSTAQWRLDSTRSGSGSIQSHSAPRPSTYSPPCTRRCSGTDRSGQRRTDRTRGMGGLFHPSLRALRSLVGDRPRRRVKRRGVTSQPPMITVGKPVEIIPPCMVKSPMRAAGRLPTRTVMLPLTIMLGGMGTAHKQASVTRACGMLPVMTVGMPVMMMPPTCGIGMGLGGIGVASGQTCMSVMREAGGMLRLLRAECAPHR